MVLDDETEPGPVRFDCGSGANFHTSTDWWVYDGTLGAPRASRMRGSCACGWRGERLYPIDWTQVDGQAPYQYDTSGPLEDWQRHVDAVTACLVPLPDGLADLIEKVGEELDKLADDAPLAALRAVAALERTTDAVGRNAAHYVMVDKSSPEAKRTALGLPQKEADSRILHYLHRRPV